MRTFLSVQNFYFEALALVNIHISYSLNVGIRKKNHIIRIISQLIINKTYKWTINRFRLFILLLCIGTIFFLLNNNFSRTYIYCIFRHFNRNNYLFFLFFFLLKMTWTFHKKCFSYFPFFWLIMLDFIQIKT
jgi:hypothetical protein